MRFLDVSNPKSISQIGYAMMPGASTSAAYFVPWRPDIVYSADYGRGLDVFKIDDGFKRVFAMLRFVESIIGRLAQREQPL